MAGLEFWADRTAYVHPRVLRRRIGPGVGDAERFGLVAALLVAVVVPVVVRRVAGRNDAVAAVDPAGVVFVPGRGVRRDRSDLRILKIESDGAHRLLGDVRIGGCARGA